MRLWRCEHCGSLYVLTEGQETQPPFIRLGDRVGVRGDCGPVKATHVLRAMTPDEVTALVEALLPGTPA